MTTEDSLAHLKKLCSAKKDYEALDAIRKELKESRKQPEVSADQPKTPATTSSPPSNDFLLLLHEKIKETFGATPAWRIPQEGYFKLVEECKKHG